MKYTILASLFWENVEKETDGQGGWGSSPGSPKQANGRFKVINPCP